MSAAATEESPIIHEKSALAPSFSLDDKIASLDKTRSLLVYSYTGLCRRTKRDVPLRYLPKFVAPKIVRDRLSELNLAKLMTDLINYMEVSTITSLKILIVML